MKSPDPAGLIVNSGGIAVIVGVFIYPVPNNKPVEALSGADKNGKIVFTQTDGSVASFCSSESLGIMRFLLVTAMTRRICRYSRFWRG